MENTTKSSVEKLLNLTNEWEQKTPDVLSKVQKMYAEQPQQRSNNPFLNREGKLVNPYINYQAVLDNPNVADKAKEFITSATGLSPTPVETKTETSQAPAVQEMTETPVTGDGTMGFISAKYETGGYNPGMVSTVKGDYGGTSYGVSMFSTNTGSADQFISWLKQTNPDMGQYFGNYKAGTPEFTNAWKQVYANYGDRFGNYQTQYTYDKIVRPLIDLAKTKTGVDFSRSQALRELVYSTAVQFGGGSLGLSALGDISANMSDTDIINASYDKKTSNYKSFFKDSSSAVQESVKNRFSRERNDVLALVGNSASTQPLTSTASSSIGKKIANTSTYNNNAAKGQCVWYVRGRAAEKLGKDPGAIGNANEMWYNAKPAAKLSASIENIRPNTIVSYKSGTSTGGQKYGHVIFIEDVIGDTVYYTEGGSGYYKNGTDGVVKTASKKGILSGINSNGTRFGSGLIGLIDVTKL